MISVTRVCESKKLLYIAIVLAIIALTSCQPSAQMPPVLMEGIEQSCQLPCWNDITPEQTTFFELQSNPLVTNPATGSLECLTSNPEARDVVSFSNRCTWNLDGADILFEYGWTVPAELNATAIYVGWTPNHPQYTLRNAVNTFGAPEAAWAVRYIKSDETCYCGSMPTDDPLAGGAKFALLYPDHGMMIFSDFTSAARWPCICPDTTISSIRLEQPINAGEQLDRWFWSTQFRPPMNHFGPEQERLGDFPDWGFEVLP